MRSHLSALAGLLLVALGLTGCSGDDASPSAEPAPSVSVSTSAPSTPAPSESPFTPAPASPDVAGSEACAQVRAGVDAFNAGDPDETVARFEAAVPLAEKQADGSPASDELIEAVRWYAALPAEDYLEAFQTSPDFARYQAITLSQCVGGGPGSTESSDGGMSV